MIFGKKTEVTPIDGAPSLVTRTEKTYQLNDARLVENTQNDKPTTYDVGTVSSGRGIYAMTPEALDDLIKLLVRVRGATKVAQAAAAVQTADKTPDGKKVATDKGLSQQ